MKNPHPKEKTERNKSLVEDHKKLVNFIRANDAQSIALEFDVGIESANVAIKNSHPTQILSDKYDISNVRVGQILNKFYSKCPSCGTGFVPKSKNHKFCSVNCRSYAYAIKLEKQNQNGLQGKNGFVISNTADAAEIITVKGWDDSSTTGAIASPDENKSASVTWTGNKHGWASSSSPEKEETTAKEKIITNSNEWTMFSLEEISRKTSLSKTFLVSCATNGTIPFIKINNRWLISETNIKNILKIK